MIAIANRLPLVAACLGLLIVTGCAGASANIVADSSRFPISMSPVVRDQSGQLLERQHLVKVGDFHASSTKVAVLYSLLPTRTFDISEEVNRQVTVVGGEAVVNFAIEAGDGCGFLNGFFILNAIPVWPGCVPITVTGDIVKRASKPPIVPSGSQPNAPPAPPHSS
jgi:hypothetical protein